MEEGDEEFLKEYMVDFILFFYYFFCVILIDLEINE